MSRWATVPLALFSILCCKLAIFGNCMKSMSTTSKLSILKLTLSNETNVYNEYVYSTHGIAWWWHGQSISWAAVAMAQMYLFMEQLQKEAEEWLVHCLDNCCGMYHLTESMSSFISASSSSMVGASGAMTLCEAPRQYVDMFKVMWQSWHCPCTLTVLLYSRTKTSSLGYP